jgi:hypothetical protein
VSRKRKRQHQKPWRGRRPVAMTGDGQVLITDELGRVRARSGTAPCGGGVLHDVSVAEALSGVHGPLFHGRSGVIACGCQLKRAH